MSDLNIGLLFGFITGTILGAIWGRDLLLWQQARRLKVLRDEHEKLLEAGRKRQHDQTHPGC
jgi:hypothetical protein